MFTICNNQTQHRNCDRCPTMEGAENTSAQDLQELKNQRLHECATRLLALFPNQIEDAHTKKFVLQTEVFSEGDLDYDNGAIRKILKKKYIPQVMLELSIRQRISLCGQLETDLEAVANDISNIFPKGQKRPTYCFASYSCVMNDAHQYTTKVTDGMLRKFYEERTRKGKRKAIHNSYDTQSCNKKAVTETRSNSTVAHPFILHNQRSNSQHNHQLLKAPPPQRPSPGWNMQTTYHTAGNHTPTNQILPPRQPWTLVVPIPAQYHTPSSQILPPRQPWAPVAPRVFGQSPVVPTRTPYPSPLSVQHARREAALLRSFKAKEKVRRLLKSPKDCFTAKGEVDNALRKAVAFVNEHFEKKLNDGSLQGDELKKYELTKAFYDNLQQHMLNDCQRSKGNRYPKILANYCVQKCISCGQKQYKEFAELWGWPTHGRVSEECVSFLLLKRQMIGRVLTTSVTDSAT